ncbi:MAG: hypothetical protein AAF629_37150, partial [Chloroflexota bacterium]
DDVLGTYLRDNVQARLLLPDGTYKRLHPNGSGEPVDSQAEFLKRGLLQREALRLADIPL